ncbi:MAG TPA: GDCCVxC domain-containing (seleno)protein [Methylibium sp.]|uniref:GDCCVxC domain-containing (seleno)protein n=1 Tax=Methylibium sp. TaxID=2067992 RepID=UPI002DBACB42|nr:GDCCVxC domain-containing (seleno)protein [Methylibium sp.]HEU4459945.1 GDCCVxC domain-containing (seleno)protein [Methylibium sp.]
MVGGAPGPRRASVARREPCRIVSTVVLTSTLTCPHCACSTTESMPTDHCLWMHECPHCHAMLRPRHGDCCAFCSYGSVPCPLVQQAGDESRSCSG